MKIFKAILTRNPTQAEADAGHAPELVEYEIFISAESLKAATTQLYSTNKVSFVEVKGIAMACDLTIL